MRFVASLVVIVILSLVSSALAQFNCGPAWGRWGFTELGLCKSSTASPPPVYVGPGNIVSGAAAWWGLRCYTLLYSGNVARIKSPSDALTTTIACDGAGNLTTSGSALATTCAVSCTIDLLYDQSGNNGCSGACDLSQPVEATRPFLIQNCVNFRLCARFASGQNLLGAAAPSVFQPFSSSSVHKRTANFTTQQGVMTDTNCYGVLYINSANTVGIYYAAVGFATQTANDSSFNSVIGIFNGASSTTTVNNSTGSPGNNGAASLGAAGGLYVIGAACGNFMGDFAQGGFWPVGFSGGQVTNLYTNDHNYYSVF